MVTERRTLCGSWLLAEAGLKMGKHLQLQADQALCIWPQAMHNNAHPSWLKQNIQTTSLQLNSNHSQRLEQSQRGGTGRLASWQ